MKIIVCAIFCSKGEFFDTPKVIVEEEKLDELLSCCRACSGVCQLEKARQGAYIRYHALCLQCGHEYSFETTPKVGRLAHLILFQSLELHGFAEFSTLLGIRSGYVV